MMSYDLISRLYIAWTSGLRDDFLLRFQAGHQWIILFDFSLVRWWFQWGYLQECTWRAYEQKYNWLKDSCMMEISHPSMGDATWRPHLCSSLPKRHAAPQQIISFLFSNCLLPAYRQLQILWLSEVLEPHKFHVSWFLWFTLPLQERLFLIWNK